MKKVTTAGYINDINKLKNTVNGNARYSFAIDGKRYYTATDSSYTDIVKNAKPGHYIGIIAPRGKTVSKITLIHDHNPNLLLASYGRIFTYKSLVDFLIEIRELMKLHGITTEIPYSGQRNNYTAVDLYKSFDKECCMTNLECGSPRECADRVIVHYYQMINNRD